MDITFCRKTVNSLPASLRNKLPESIGVIEISQRESRRLNLIYRKKNQPANVLSFRYGPDYGEILVCPEVIKKEAKKQGHTFVYQLTWMVLHGMIHLGDLHHENSPQVSAKAGRIEKRTLDKIFGVR